jgi:hypothetical protein
MKKKSKYNRGTQHKDYWVFGGVERSTGKWFCQVVNDDRTKPTLSQHIKNHIAPESTIMSDKFAALCRIMWLQRLFAHKKGGKRKKGDMHTFSNML